MKKIQLIIALALIVITIFAFVGCEGDNALISADGNYKYELITLEGNKAVKLLQYIGNEEHVIIPTHLDSYPVTELSDGLFVNTIDKKINKKKGDVYTANEQLKKVTIQSNIKELSPRIFYYCTELIQVNLADSVEKIGAFAFFGCTKLENITLPAAVKVIEGYAFRECLSLKNININSTELPKIGEKVFYYINENKPGKDKYSIIDGLNINVADISLFQVESIDSYFRSTKSMDYIYWNDYSNLIRQIEE